MWHQARHRHSSTISTSTDMDMDVHKNSKWCFGWRKPTANKLPSLLLNHIIHLNKVSLMFSTHYYVRLFSCCFCCCSGEGSERVVGAAVLPRAPQSAHPLFVFISLGILVLFAGASYSFIQYWIQFIRVYSKKKKSFCLTAAWLTFMPGLCRCRAGVLCRAAVNRMNRPKI